MRLALFALLALAALGQDDPQRNVTFRAGGGFPTGKQLRGLDNRPLLGLGYGYRWNRHGQFDLGFDNVFRGSDTYVFLVPLGLRYIQPFADDRFQAYGGAGGVYMRNQAGAGRSQNLGGYYVQAGGNAALDYERRFRVGGSLRYYTGYNPINRWWALAGEFTYTFSR